MATKSLHGYTLESVGDKLCTHGYFPYGRSTMRFVFVPPASDAAGLLDLPWEQRLSDWADRRLVEPRDEGIHRHVVRFVEDSGIMWAIKELPERAARREYRLLGRLADLGIPSVTVQGVVVDRAAGVDPALVTRYLEYSSTYRALFSEPRGLHPRDRLLDALVELLVRLHLAGFYWGDCSLSNTLFRLDAGELAAYLVDAETAELHTSLSEGQRLTDMEIACENVAGELLDLQAGGMLDLDVEPEEVAADLERRYAALWGELTSEWLIPRGQEERLVTERVRRINNLGFDVKEMELFDAGGSQLKLKVETRVSEPGHHRTHLYQRTGLVAEENQARRLLTDLASYRAMLENATGGPLSEAVAANRWLNEVYGPVVAAIPAELRDKLDPVQVFHEVLEHRWFLSEEAGSDVGTETASDSYFKEVLPKVPDDLTSGRITLSSLNAPLPEPDSSGG